MCFACVEHCEYDRNKVKQGPPESSCLANTSYCVIHLPLRRSRHAGSA